MKKPRLLLLIIFLLMGMVSEGKKYPFDMSHSYKIEQIRVAQNDSRFVKVWGIGSSVDKAVTRALQDGVAACIFEGIPPCQSAGAVPPLCAEGREAYSIHQSYFKQFFTKGDFLRYIKNTNTRYPTGENNVNTPDGRLVAIYAVIDVQELRKRLESDGIVKSMKDVFDN